MPHFHQWTRREFGRMALAGAPFAALTASLAAQERRGRPNSVVHGVSIGVISSSFIGLAASEIIPAMIRLGISQAALQPNHTEALAGAPIPAPAATAPAAAQALSGDGLLPRCASLTMVVTPPLSGAGGGRGGRGAPAPEQKAAQE